MKAENCGYLEFEYEVKQTSGNTVTRDTRFLRMDLGIISSMPETLTKQADTSVNIASMGPRYNYYVDKGNTRSLSITFSRISPSRPAHMPGFIPETYEYVHDGYTDHPFKFGNVCCDQQQVTDNMTFMGVCSTDADPDGEYYSSEKWSNAYWIKGLEKCIDRWQMKFDGAEFVYYGEEDLDPYIRRDTRYHVYASNLEYTFSAGEAEQITGSLSLSIGRRLRTI